jgi:hypothetical protein
MERAAVRLPLPASLRRELRSIPGAAAADASPPALPRLPVPAALQERLRAIPGPSRVARPLPVWLRSPRYAVAASYLIALLSIQLLGDPSILGRRAVDSAAERWNQVWTAAAPGERLRGFESRVSARYGQTRESLAASFVTLGSRVSAMRELIPESFSESRRRVR